MAKISHCLRDRWRRWLVIVAAPGRGRLVVAGPTQTLGPEEEQGCGNDEPAQHHCHHHAEPSIRRGALGARQFLDTFVVRAVTLRLT